MNTLDDYVPPPGLLIPVVTVLDAEGRVLEDEQRAAIRFVVQNGHGADIIFAVGTNGEWNRLDNPRRQQVFRVALKECRRLSSEGIPVEAWLGVTGHSRAETLENLACAIDLAGDAVVLAPLSIRDVDNVVEFVERDVAQVFAKSGRTLPLFLYENAHIAAPSKPLHLELDDVARLSRLNYVRGIKVTADREVLDRFVGAAASFRQTHDFPIYAGNAYLIFDLLAPYAGLSGRVHGHQGFPLRGIVCGPANMTPREWKRAWQVTLAGDRGLMDIYRELLDGYREACFFERGGRRVELGIACLKATLAHLDVISSACVAPGTDALHPAEQREFLRRLQALRERAAKLAEPGYLSRRDSTDRAGRAANNG